jgi:hypothetical protein
MSLLRLTCGVCCVLVAGLCVSSLGTTELRAEESADPAGLKLFDSDVRTLLNTHCGACHTGEDVEGEFDLTTRAGLMKGGPAGPAIVPGRPADSILIKLIRHQKKPAMPQDADPLPEPVIAKLEEWVRLGAPYSGPLIELPTAPSWTDRKIATESRQHWAYQPLRPVTPPVPSDGAWSVNPLDAFIRAAQEQAQLTPNPPVDRRTFARRVTFDLIGLPPTPEELAAYLADESPDADAKLVDRLLASPHYGERWGRHWLDLVRFAESHGFEHDYDRPTAYHYRDFVIQALNSDLPFTDFVRWQVAGDELAPDNNLALMATGFLAAGVHSTQITANEVEKHRYDELDDIVATLGTSMLGLTIGCARCHDHKFDAFPQADYYRLMSTFTTTVRSEVDLDFDPAGYARAKAAFDLEHKPFVTARETFEATELAGRFATWEASRGSEPLPGWATLVPTRLESKGKAQFQPQPDGSYLVTGPNVPNDQYTFVCEIGQTGLRHVRLEVLPDPSLPQSGPGRAANGNFALSDLKLFIAPKSAPDQKTRVPLANARATFEQKGLPVAAIIDDNLQSAWAVDPEFGKPQAAVFDVQPGEAGALPGFPEGTVLTFELQFNNNTQHSIGRPRLSIATTAVPDDLRASAWPQPVLEALALAPETRTADQSKLLLNWYKSVDARWLELETAEKTHAATAPKPDLRKVLISSEGLPAVRLHTQGADFLPETNFLRRGDVALKDGVAAQGFLQVLMPAPDAGSKWLRTAPTGSRTSLRRTALADWLTDVEQGGGSLLARVIANRLWQHHFGRGIVSTPSDFGVRGEPATHPELLEWLAGDLVASGWKLKSLHRRMMLSNTYRQSAGRDPAKLALDRDNRFWWRKPRRRLEAEVIRDSLLAVSGRLDSRQFGPGSLDPSMPRRSIYLTVKRSQMVPVMQVFDCPDGLSGQAERGATTVAPQALLLLNSDLVRTAAAGVSTRESAGTPGERINRLYQRVLARPASTEEVASGLAFLDRQQATHTQAGKSDAQALAWQDFCHVLLCLNEFVYIE